MPNPLIASTLTVMVKEESVSPSEIKINNNYLTLSFSYKTNRKYKCLMGMISLNLQYIGNRTKLKFQLQLFGRASTGGLLTDGNTILRDVGC